MENKINVLNTDLNIFNQFLPNENLTHYFKTKNNFNKKLSIKKLLIKLFQIKNGLKKYIIKNVT